MSEDARLLVPRSYSEAEDIKRRLDRVERILDALVIALKRESQDRKERLAYVGPDIEIKT